MSAPAAGPTPGAFGSRLRAALDDRGPLCVGIDPHASLLRDWGLDDDLAGLERFTRTAVEALADRVALVKPQSAFFERAGSAGIAVLERCLADIRAAGALALLDVKRGDIGSTMEAYAEAYLAPGAPLQADAVTASPYLGVGALRPLLDLATRSGGGVFVLALTSNPEGAAVQRARTTGGATVAAHVVDEISSANRGAYPLGSFGVVVGATLAEVGLDLLPLNGPVLAPGLGAQGASAAGLPALFGAALPNVVPTYSRSVLRAGPDLARLRAAAEATLEECRQALAA